MLQAAAIWTKSPFDLPEDVQSLFTRAGQDIGVEGFYASLEWYDLLCRTATPQGAEPGYLVVRDEARPVAVLPLWRLDKLHWQSLTAPYSCLHTPLLTADLDDVTIARIARAVATAVRAEQVETLRLDCLDADWPALAPFCSGLGQGGLVVLRFAHFGNWHSQIAFDGQPTTWDFYHARLEGSLRETIRRRTAKVKRDGGFRFALIEGGEALPAAVEAFEAVYAQSWKQDEPHPDFNAEMIKLCAARGVLRLGVLWHHDKPVAVQYWLVSFGVAQVLKLAHLPDYEKFSPGTVLTAWTIEQILSADGVHSLDFGRGDDDYKRAWVGQRHQRVGIIAANPHSAAGLKLIARHALGRVRRFFAS